MLYYPNVPTRDLERTPNAGGLAYEEVHLTTPDGVRIHGWFLPAPPATAKDLTLLFFHGNAGNISHRIEKCQVFLDLGFDVLIIDYRGYGQSEGRPDEPGTYQDAQAAHDYLTRERGQHPERIVLYSESLGTGVAVDLAARAPVGGIVLEAPFTSIPDVAQRIFWFLPVHPLVRNRYDSLRKIGGVRAPLLILHRRDDEYLKLRHARRLLDAARSAKRLVELHGQHADAFFASEELCRDALRAFIADLTAGEPAGGLHGPVAL
jgi:fermentation-respiration switch protein FrsA (DUF1100 family)